MKKSILAVVILVSSSTFAGTVPNDYTPFTESQNVHVYKDNTKDIYAIVTDTRNASISFGGNVGAYSTDAYYKGSITEHWNQNSNSGSLVAINGQFFDIIGGSWKYFTSSPAKLVYPVKSNYIAISSNVYDTNFSLRSLVIKSDGKTYINEGFSSSIFNQTSTKEYLTGLYPSAVKSPNELIGRNYIGGIPSSGCNPSTTSCSYDYLVFFIAKSATHYDMLNQMSIWGINAKSQIMMDGSGSVKMYLHTYEGDTVLNGNFRQIPNSIIIGD